MRYDVKVLLPADAEQIMEELRENHSEVAEIEIIEGIGQVAHLRFNSRGPRRENGFGAIHLLRNQKVLGGSIKSPNL